MGPGICDGEPVLVVAPEGELGICGGERFLVVVPEGIDRVHGTTWWAFPEGVINHR